jgi:hypothetical protein
MRAVLSFPRDTFPWTSYLIDLTAEDVDVFAALAPTAVGAVGVMALPPELEELIPAENVLARSNTDPITRKTFCLLQLIRQNPPLRWGKASSTSGNGS